MRTLTVPAAARRSSSGSAITCATTASRAEGTLPGCAARVPGRWSARFEGQIASMPVHPWLPLALVHAHGLTAGPKP